MSAFRTSMATPGRRWFEVCDLSRIEDLHSKDLTAAPPQQWEMEIMILIAHQGAVPMDQFARFFNYSPQKAARTAEYLEERGFVERHNVFAAMPVWIALTPHGNRACGTGFPYFEVVPGSCARTRAVNEVRLYLAERAPAARWISRRLLQHDAGGNMKVPNAVVEINGERHAVEVRVSDYNLWYCRKTVERRCMEDYDAVVCFCVPVVQRYLERMKKKYGWPRVLIRSLPGLDDG